MRARDVVRLRSDEDNSPKNYARDFAKIRKTSNESMKSALTYLRQHGYMEVEDSMNVRLSDEAKAYVDQLLKRMTPGDFLLIEAYYADSWNARIDYGDMLQPIK